MLEGIDLINQNQGQNKSINHMEQNEEQHINTRIELGLRHGYQK